MDRRQFMGQGASTAVLAAALGPGACATEPNPGLSSRLDHLAAALRGGLYLPGAPDYERLKRNYEARYDFHPAAIAHCTSPADVREAIAFARQQRLPLAVRCGGHSYAGYSGCNGIVLDLSGLNQIAVDAPSMSVRVGGGALVGDIDQATAATGCAAVMGECPSVGVGGLTTGGGVGLLMGKYGLACDNLISAQVVLADGRLMNASAEENADLFWAVRGGGGNFGVVTEFVFRAHNVSNVLGGEIVFSADDPAALMRGLRAFVAEMPDELTIFCIFTTGENARPVLITQLCYCGDPSAGAAVVASLRQIGAVLADRCHPQTYLALQSSAPRDIPPAFEENRSLFVSALDDDVIALVGRALTHAPANYSLWLIPLHGAVVRVPEDATAFSVRSPGMFVNATGEWRNPADRVQASNWTLDIASKLEPYGRGRGNYVNIMGRENNAAVRAAYAGNYARLARLKRRYDPMNVFSLNQNIAPA